MLNNYSVTFEHRRAILFAQVLVLCQVQLQEAHGKGLPVCPMLFLHGLTDLSGRKHFLHIHFLLSSGLSYLLHTL